jgi:hypothetical protein
MTQTIFVSLGLPAVTQPCYDNYWFPLLALIAFRIRFRGPCPCGVVSGEHWGAPVDSVPAGRYRYRDGRKCGGLVQIDNPYLRADDLHKGFEPLGPEVGRTAFGLSNYPIEILPVT